MIQKEEAAQNVKEKTSPSIKGPTVTDSNNPFQVGNEGFEQQNDPNAWVVNECKPKYDKIFNDLNPVNGKVSGSGAKNEMVKSKLPNSVLGKIWKLADHDKDGYLDDEEFALAM